MNNVDTAKEKADSAKEKANDVKDKSEEEVKKQLNDIRSDLFEIRDKWRTTDGDAPSKTKYVFVKHLNKILFIASVVLFLGAYFQVSITIPEWFYIALATTVLGGFAAYPLANWLASKFVKDDRKPIVEVNPEDLSDFHIYKVPVSKVPDIDVVDGEMHELNNGRAYEVQQFGYRQHNGETVLTSFGTWLGAKTGLEVHRKESEYKQMRKDLKPYVEMAIQYDVKMPNIKHKITSQVANEFVREFEGVTSPDGKSMHDEIQKEIDETMPDFNREEFTKEKSVNMENGANHEISDTMVDMITGDSNE